MPSVPRSQRPATLKSSSSKRNPPGPLPSPSPTMEIMILSGRQWTVCGAVRLGAAVGAIPDALEAVNPQLKIHRSDLVQGIEAYRNTRTGIVSDLGDAVAGFLRHGIREAMAGAAADTEGNVKMARNYYANSRT